VITPAFVADCLETLEEIAIEGEKTFKQAGGEWFQAIPCLNDQKPYITFLADRARRWLADCPSSG
jgi:ferrochelatase